MAEVTWMRLVDPTPDELERIGAGCWCECRRCGGRASVLLPADLPDVIPALNAILEAHRGCQPPLAPFALTEDRSAQQLAADGDAPPPAKEIG